MRQPDQSQGSGDSQPAPGTSLPLPGAVSVPPSVPSIDPVAVLPLPNDVMGRASFGSIVVDGVNELVYVRHPDGVVGWGERAKWFAPDAALVAIPVAAIVLVLALRRMVRRPQVRGRRYCAACNYDLTPAVDPGGAISGVCPECGVDPVRRPTRVGRTAARRFGVLIVGAVLVLVASLVVLFARVDRPYPGMWQAAEWPMPILGKHIPALRFAKVEQSSGERSELLVFSIGTGKLIATPMSRENAMVYETVISEDGGLLAMTVSEHGSGGGYGVYLVPIANGVPGKATLLEGATVTPPNVVGIGFQPVEVSNLLPDGSRWLYLHRSWMPMEHAAPRFRTELVRVRVKEERAVGSWEAVAAHEPLIHTGRRGERETPYHQWVVHHENVLVHDSAQVRIAHFVDNPINAVAASAPTTGPTRSVTVVAFPETTSGEISRASTPLVGREIPVTFAGNAFFSPRLEQGGNVLRFEPSASPTTLAVDLATGVVTTTPRALNGPMLSIERLGWNVTSGPSIVDESDTTIAMLGGNGKFHYPSAISRDGRWVAGFSHHVSGQGWWNEFGIGPWNHAEVLVWDLAELDGWRPLE